MHGHVNYERVIGQTLQRQRVAKDNAKGRCSLPLRQVIGCGDM